MIASSAPTRTSVGTAICASSAVRSWRAAIPRKAPATARAGVFSMTSRIRAINCGRLCRVVSEKSLGSSAAATAPEFPAASTLLASSSRPRAASGVSPSALVSISIKARNRSGYSATSANATYPPIDSPPRTTGSVSCRASSVSITSSAIASIV